MNRTLLLLPFLTQACAPAAPVWSDTTADAAASVVLAEPLGAAPILAVLQVDAPLVEGLPGRAEATGLPPGRPAWLLVSPRLSGRAACPPLFGECLALPEPFAAVAQATVDAQGRAVFTLTPPSPFAPDEVLFQAVARAGTRAWATNAVVTSVVEALDTDLDTGAPIDTDLPFDSDGDTDTLVDTDPDTWLPIDTDIPVEDSVDDTVSDTGWDTGPTCFARPGISAWSAPGALVTADRAIPLQGVPVDAPLTVQFAGALPPGVLVSLRDVFDQPVPATVTFPQPDSVTVVPSSDLAEATVYAIEVTWPCGATRRVGLVTVDNGLVDPLVPPMSSAREVVDPARGSTGVDVLQPLRVTYEMPFAPAVEVRVIGGPAGPITWSADLRTVIVEPPAGGWPDGTTIFAGLSLWGKALTSTSFQAQAACPPITTEPVAGQTDVSPYGPFLVQTPSPVSTSALSITLTGPLGPVPSRGRSLPDGTLVIDPNQPLSPSTPYTLQIGTPCPTRPQVLVPFTTRATPTAPAGADLDGEVYEVLLEDFLLIEPPGVASLYGSLLGGIGDGLGVVLHDWDGATQTLDLSFARLDDTGAQDECAPTWGPVFVEYFGGRLSGEAAEVRLWDAVGAPRLQDVVITGVPTATGLLDARVSFLMSEADLAVVGANLGLPAAGICGLLPTFTGGTASCVPCPIRPGSCVAVELALGGATLTSGPGMLTTQDVLADPTCQGDVTTCADGCAQGGGGLPASGLTLLALLGLRRRRT